MCTCHPASPALSESLFQLGEALFACNHARTPVEEGKVCCPDCGAGVVFHWVLLRCASCNSRRESRYFLRQAIPVHGHCLSCGESAVRREVLDSPKYYQLHQALLVMSTEADYVLWLSDRLTRWSELWTGVPGRVWSRFRQSVARQAEAFTTSCENSYAAAPAGTVRVWFEQAKPAASSTGLVPVIG